MSMPATAEWIWIAAAAIGLGLAAPSPAMAQAPRPAARPAPPAPPSTVVPAAPQQTTASFADWTLRCTQAAPSAGSGPASKFCEVVQNIQQNDRPVAQIAVGRPMAGQKLQLTLLVPTNVSFQGGPGLLAGSEGDPAPALSLTWRRCLPIGCIADAPLDTELMTKLRGWTEAGRIVFTDAAGRPAGVPFSPRGLAQALDALAKEEGAG